MIKFVNRLALWLGLVLLLWGLLVLSGTWLAVFFDNEQTTWIQTHLGTFCKCEFELLKSVLSITMTAGAILFIGGLIAEQIARKNDN